MNITHYTRQGTGKSHSGIVIQRAKEIHQPVTLRFSSSVDPSLGSEQRFRFQDRVAFGSCLCTIGHLGRRRFQSVTMCEGSLRKQEKPLIEGAMHCCLLATVVLRQMATTDVRKTHLHLAAIWMRPFRPERFPAEVMTCCWSPIVADDSIVQAVATRPLVESILLALASGAVAYEWKIALQQAIL